MPGDYFSILGGGVVVTPLKVSSRRKRPSSGCVGCPSEDKRYAERNTSTKDLDSGVLVWTLDRGEGSAEARTSTASWFWKRVTAWTGLDRDQFALQHLVRCITYGKVDEYGPLYRAPNAEELDHCDLHTYSARVKSTAKVWIVVGREARDQMFPTMPKDKQVFWSEQDKVRVFCIDTIEKLHGLSVRNWRYKEFKAKMVAIRGAIKHPRRKFDWFKSNDFARLITHEDMRRFLRLAKASGERVAVDIEAGYIRGKWKILCIGFSYEKDSARCIVLHHPKNQDSNAFVDRAFEIVAGFLEDREVEKVFHYGCSDTDELASVARIRVRGYKYDTNLSNFLRHSYRRKHGLEAISQEGYYNYAEYKELIKDQLGNIGEDQISGVNYADIPIETMVLYNCGDTALTKRIELDTRELVPTGLVTAYTWAGVTLYRMQSRGPKLDRRYFQVVAEFVPNRVQATLRKIRAITGNPQFNPNQVLHVQAAIYEQFRLAKPEVDRDGKITRPADEQALLAIIGATDHPFPKLILDYRKFSVMDVRYVTTYQTSADLHGGELRTLWHLTGAVTGRLRSGASGDKTKGVVNLQNLHGSPLLQNLLVSDFNWEKMMEEGATWDDLLDLDVFLALDYSQIEVRMLAEVSGDKKLLAQFELGEDIHAQVGAELTGLSFESIMSNKVIRTFIKGLHFGIIYGLTARSLFNTLRSDPKTKDMGYTLEYVEGMYAKYFRKYAGVALYMRRTWEFAQENHYIETIFGFRRYIGPEFDENRETMPENQSKNAPIQGAAHQLLINALALLHVKPKKYSRLLAPLMEVHDAIVWRVKVRHLHEACKQARYLLEVDAKAFAETVLGRRVKVPLVAEASVGFRYGVMVEYDAKVLAKAGGSLPSGKIILRDLLDKNSKVVNEIEKECGLKAW